MIIKGFPNYSITKEGVITNIETNTVKKCWLAKNGYYYVDLFYKKTRKKIALHRLLAIHFIPNKNNKRTVNHKDGNKLNNDLTNLEWCTDSENIKHAYDNNLNSAVKKLENKDLKNVVDIFLKGTSLQEIAKIYNVSAGTLSSRLSKYIDETGKREDFQKELTRQKSKQQLTAKRKCIQVQMIDKTSGKVLKTFNKLKDAARFLNKNTSGPISNCIKGRQKSAYGYFWKVYE